MTKLILLALHADRHPAPLHTGPAQRTRLYRLVDVIGRWSMIDVFMVTILTALRADGPARFGDAG